jgi:hypothetical protein
MILPVCSPASPQRPYDALVLGEDVANENRSANALMACLVAEGRLEMSA